MTPGVTIRIDAEISFPIAGLDAGVFDVLRTGDLVFPNPEYEKRQKRNLWLGDTPEQIAALEVYEGRAYFPRACLREVRRVLEFECGVSAAVERVPLPTLEPLAAPTVLELRDYQQQAVAAATKLGGVVVLPPGSGKTIIGAGIASALDLPTLVIVHTKDLLDQWIGAFDKTLGIEAGRVGGGRKAQIKPITIAMIQTLVRWNGDKLRGFGDRFGAVITDEGHHCPASTYQRVIRCFRALYRIALTATPDRDDGRTPILYWTMGPIVYRLGHRPLVSKGHLVLPKIRAVRSSCNPIPETSTLSCAICRRRWDVPTLELLPEETAAAVAEAAAAAAVVEAEAAAAVETAAVEISPDDLPPERLPKRIELLPAAAAEIPHVDLPCPHCLERIPKRLEVEADPERIAKLAGDLTDAETSAKVEQDFSWLVTELTLDDDRNHLLEQIAASEALAGRRVLLLSGRKAHCHLLADRLQSWGYAAEAVDSDTAKRKRAGRIQALRDGEILILCATSLADEGLDVPLLDSVILATPQRAPGRTLQRVGRVMRPGDGKAPTVFDVIDADNGLARAQWYQRRGAYRKTLGVTPERLSPWRNS